MRSPRIISTLGDRISFQGLNAHSENSLAQVRSCLGRNSFRLVGLALLATTYNDLLGPFMLPTKGPYFLPATIHCPLDHLRMHFDSATRVYRCNLSSCGVAYAPSRGYYLIGEGPAPAQSHESFYGQAAVCLC